MDASTPIDDLDLSVAGLAALRHAGIESLGELLARPVLDVPRRVAHELELLFEDEGLVFAGELRVATIATVPATGDVDARWATISAWLAEHQPHVLRDFRPPATEAAIADAEARMGLSLPADYRRFLALHDGQQECSAMVWTCSLHPVDALAAARQEQLGLAEEATVFRAEEVGPGVRAVQYSPRWIPIGTSARGRDFLSLDLDPGEGGTVGQVILTAVDTDAHRVIASSFTELLSVFFEGVQNGDVDVEASRPDDDG